jgi:hypothetical protein
MVLYAYRVLIVFSLHRESPNLILVGETLILRWFYHISHDIVTHKASCT